MAAVGGAIAFLFGYVFVQGAGCISRELITQSPFGAVLGSEGSSVYALRALATNPAVPFLDEPCSSLCTVGNRCNGRRCSVRMMPAVFAEAFALSLVQKWGFPIADKSQPFSGIVFDYVRRKPQR